MKDNVAGDQLSSLLQNVFISYCCCIKLLQTWWLKTTQIYYLTVLEIKNLKIKALGGRCVISEGSGEESFLASSNFQRPPAFLGSIFKASSADSYHLSL